MIVKRLTSRLTLALILAAVAVLVLANTALAAKPVQLIPAGHIANEFSSPQSVAVAPSENIYVADRGNNRIQELTPSGEFVLMFGWDVNKTEVEASASQAERNICTAASHNTCQPGTQGTAPGQFSNATSLAIDQATGDLYVQELSFENFRVDKYTGAGQFVWMIGKGVNKTTGTNFCSAASGNECGSGAESATDSVEPGAFKFKEGAGNLLAFGGPEQLLYVGDEQRVQEFNAEGEAKGEIPPEAFDTESGCSILQQGCKVVALAIDGEGNVYLGDNVEVGPFGEPTRVRIFKPDNTEASFDVIPNDPRLEVGVRAIAVDRRGHLASSAFESGGGSLNLLYETEEHLGRLISHFNSPVTSPGIAFNPFAEPVKDPHSGYLYVTDENEVIAYKPVPIAELTPTSVACVPGITSETSETLNCTLNGEANPEGVPNTKIWFEWGRSPALGERSLSHDVAPGTTPEPVSAEAVGVRPNESEFYYRMSGNDESVEPPEDISTAVTLATTPIVAPAIVGRPAASVVSSSLAVTIGELNPENAETQYFFEYGQQAALEECQGARHTSCPGVQTTTVQESSVYGKIGTTAEITGLQPSTLYAIRLSAESENTANTESKSSLGSIGSFTTQASPAVHAVTGAASAITQTSAVIKGVVDPDGQPATYAFELGVYAGAATQYGIAVSGQTGTAPVEESFPVTGLQPGATYAYRIKVASGYGTALGQTATFTTGGQADFVNAPIPIPMLAIPDIVFPKSPRSTTPKCKAKTVRNKQGKCVKAKKKKVKHARKRVAKSRRR